MRIVLLGCGEAFDERVGNTSALVMADSTILMDCGYAVPFQVWRHDDSPNLIDAIYISHGHADHYFGLPALLTRMWEEGRKKPLAVISQKQALEQIWQLVDLGYLRIRKRMQFPIEPIEAWPDGSVEHREFRMRFAPTMHSVANLAVRIETAGQTFCYSGDGVPTDESRALYRGADLLLHEAYSFRESPVHADIPSVIAMAEEAEVKHLVLTHVQRGVRRDDARLRSLVSRTRLSVGSPGDVFDLAGFATRDQLF